ncbi:hypothetical protein Ahy_A09g041763 [Arachis hypogaea]|uniref:Transposase MuDR plant domain-containing protein n=1 Tax=Arachis hypogaea TaxID=3818 RepID=A0A445BDR3_ARAHY|nr:hypothetical protein Ahy_A09g041763 [Arachis hypogaea]
MDEVGDDVSIDELRDIEWEEDNNNNEEEFEANYEVDDENDNRDLAGNSATLDLKAMHALKFSEYVNIGEGNVASEDGEFTVRMEFGSREVRWLIRASLIQKKGCWEIKRYNDKHTYTMGTISQDHANLDSDTIAVAIRLLGEAYPLIKVKSITAAVQSRFNYTTLPVWLKAITAKMSRRNELFEVYEMQDCSIYTVNLAQQHCDYDHFQVERLPYRHVLACCANQHLDWQVYVHDVYKMSEICKV